MKKRRSIFGAVLLSTVLAGNVFAGGSTSSGVFSFFESMTNAVASFFREEPCEGRQCSTCRPTYSSDGTPIPSATPSNCRPND